MSQVYVIDHPLIQHKLTLMRQTETGTKDFRELLNEIAMLMCYEVTRDLPLEEVEIETPICKCKSKVIAREFSDNDIVCHTASFPWMRRKEN